MRHTVVISKETGLVRDEYYSVPPLINNHVKRSIDNEIVDCFEFCFQSGAKAWYSNKHYYYEFRDGFVL